MLDFDKFARSSFLIVFLCVCLLCLDHTTGQAQALDLNHNNVHFDLLDTRKLDGELGPVDAILQDGHGFMWISSERGLIRFDGHEFRVYQASDLPNSISGNIISDLILDKTGVLWVGTTSGLSRYRDGTDDFENFVFDPDDPSGLPNAHVSSLCVDRDNRIIAGTFRGLSIFDQKSQTFTNLKPIDGDQSSLSSYEISHVFVDDQNIVWVSTHDGLNEIDLKTLSVKRRFANGEYNINRTIKDSYGNIWMGLFGRGAIRLSPDGNVTEFRHDNEDHSSIGSDTVQDVFEDSNNNIWMATDHGGLNLFKPKTETFVRFTQSFNSSGSISSNQTRHVYEDKNHTLWVGTFSGGINIVDLKNSAIKNYNHDPSNTNSLNHDAVLSLYKTQDGKIWIGTERGVNQFDPETENFVRFTSDPKNINTLRANPVLAIAEDVRGMVWFGSWSGGVDSLDRKNMIFKNYFPTIDDETTLGSAYVWEILIDSKDTLWLGTETNGLNRFNAVDGTFTRFPKLAESKTESISWRFVTDMIEDKHGVIWLSTLHGVFTLDVKTMVFSEYQYNTEGDKPLSSLRAMVLAERDNGDIWVGTQDAGISVIDYDTKEVSYIGKDEGLPSLNVAGLLEDDNHNMWVMTANGLAKVDYSDKQRIYAVKLRHGFSDNTFNRDAVLKNDDGTLYFGGLKGLSVVDPKKLVLKTPPPKVLFTDFSIEDERVLVGSPNSPLFSSIYNTQKITLNHTQNAFSIYFSALDYRANSRTKYTYRLVGFDNRWREKNKNYANYTNINPGSYVFEVKAKSIYGDPDESASKLTIVIEPAFWRTWWACSIYTFVLMFLIYFVAEHFRLRLNSRIYKELSMRDALTGVYNRNGLNQIVAGFFCNNEMRRGLSLLVIDIDDFKNINDRYGHDVGDRILTQLATVIRDSLRIGDHVARWGGEEFLALTASTTPESAFEIAEVIRKNIGQHGFKVSTLNISITVSIGLASCKPEESFEQLFKRADIALYQAKRNGRNQTWLV